MNQLFYMGHPAHFHLFRNAVQILKSRGHDVTLVIKKKDVLEELIKATGWEYININPGGRKSNKLSIAIMLLYRDLKLAEICLRKKPKVMFGTAVEITHAGRLLGIKSVVLNEDDDYVIPLFSKLAFPFADVILCPSFCTIGKWENRKTGYYGFHELAYLHPKYFSPDKKIGEQLRGDHQKYFILRFSSLDAHHDSGRSGITDELASKVISILEPHGRVYISSERKYGPQFEKYRIRINPQDMHSALFHADLYIGDSQTMAAEAAVLGTPSIRFNDFVGEISYLEELEHKYQLTFGIRTSDPGKLLSKISDILLIPNAKETWNSRREKLLNDCTDLTELLVKIAEN